MWNPLKRLFAGNSAEPEAGDCDWRAYVTQVENRPASIVVDMSLRDEAPLEELPQLLSLKLTAGETNQDDLPTSDELERITEAEKGLLKAILIDEPRCRHVGSCTANGKRETIIYIPAGARLEEGLGLAAENCPYSLEAGSAMDPDWTVYRELLLPSSQELRQIANWETLKALRDQGDKAEIPRDVFHWFYFEREQDREAFETAASGRGFAIVEETRDDSQPRALGLRIKHESTTEPVHIHTATFDLLNLAEEHNAEYDGWETSVEQKAS